MAKKTTTAEKKVFRATCRITTGTRSYLTGEIVPADVAKQAPDAVEQVQTYDAAEEELDQGQEQTAETGDAGKKDTADAGAAQGGEDTT